MLMYQKIGVGHNLLHLNTLSILEAEAMASHLGQFIHNRGKLDKMRREVADLPSIEWLTVKEGEKNTS
jgi:hypothetical protein